MLKAYTRLQARINSLKTDESGNAAEYGLIIALVSVVIIAGLTALGAALLGVFNNVATEINGPAAG